MAKPTLAQKRLTHVVERFISEGNPKEASRQFWLLSKDLTEAQAGQAMEDLAEMLYA